MNKLQEFWYCVAPQNDIPLYRGEALDGSVVAGLLTFLDYYRNNIQETFSESIQKALLHNPNFINDIRLLLGISDKRFYLDKYIEPAGVELIDELPCSYEKSVRAGRALLIY